MDADGNKVKGLLKSAEGNDFVVTTREKVKMEGKKRPDNAGCDHTYQMDNEIYQT